MKSFCKDLKEHATKIINCKKKKAMILLTTEENQLYHEQKVCHVWKKRFSTDDNDKKILWSHRSMLLH